MRRFLRMCFVSANRKNHTAACRKMYDQLSVFDAAGYITHTGEQCFGRIGLYRKWDPDISRLFVVV